MAIANNPIYTPTPPTIAPQTDDARNLADWMQRELRNISNALTNVTRLQLVPLAAPPSTPRDGLLAVADGVNWNPDGFGFGPRVFQGGVWDDLAIESVGTWTPSIQGDGGGGPPTYGTRIGTYEKIGRQVTVRFTVQTTALGGILGNVQVAGLPFPLVISGAENMVCCIGYMSGVTLDAGYTWLTALGQINGASSMFLYEHGSNKVGQVVPVGNLAAASLLVGSMAYRV